MEKGMWEWKSTRSGPCTMSRNGSSVVWSPSQHFLSSTHLYQDGVLKQQLGCWCLKCWCLGCWCLGCWCLKCWCLGCFSFHLFLLSLFLLRKDSWNDCAFIHQCALNLFDEAVSRISHHMRKSSAWYQIFSIAGTISSLNVIRSWIAYSWSIRRMLNLDGHSFISFFHFISFILDCVAW